MAHTALYATLPGSGLSRQTRSFTASGGLAEPPGNLATMTEHVWGADTIDAKAEFLPGGTPVIWYYVTGTTQRPEIEWEADDVARYPHSQLYRIDQGFGDQADKSRWFAADEFDLEALAWTPADLVPVIEARNAIEWSTRIYASTGPWLQLLAALAAAGVSARSVYWREANWNLSEAQAGQLLSVVRYAIQWASPTSNARTVIPGTTINLATAGCDLNVARLSPTGWRG